MLKINVEFITLFYKFELALKPIIKQTINQTNCMHISTSKNCFEKLGKFFIMIYDYDLGAAVSITLTFFLI